MDNIYVYVVPLPPCIREMVTPCSDGYTIYLADRLHRVDMLKAYRALRPEDVGDVLRISKTYIVQLHKVSPFTKTDSSTREVYVQSELKPVIQALRKYSDRTHFCYFKYDAYRKYLAENSERILGRKISPHALRHTMTSLMAGEGIPLEVISRRLGHSDSDITKRVYFHVVEQLKDRDAKLIEHVKLL